MPTNQMYGLTSRDSLSKRQSRWVREVDESVRSNPAQRAINQETPTISNRSSSHTDPRDNLNIITLMSSNDTDSSVSLAFGQNPMLRKDSNHPTSAEYLSSRNKPIKNIITPLQENIQQLDTLSLLVNELKNDNAELYQKYSKLENDYQILKNSVSDSSELSVRVDRIEQQQNPLYNLDARISHLESEVPLKYNRVQPLINEFPTLVNRIENLEQSLSELSSRSGSSGFFSQAINVRDNDNSSEFSVLTDNSEPCPEPQIHNLGKREFIPFFIREEYAGRDNKTFLHKTNMNMLVNIVGLFNDIPIIYPFGTAKDLPHFVELTLDMQFTDAEKIVNGTVYGIFKRGSDGIYTIKITELYSDGEASGIEKFTLPLTITCDCDLILE